MRKVYTIVLALIACCVAIIAVHASKVKMSVYGKYSTKEYLVSDVDSVTFYRNSNGDTALAIDYHNDKKSISFNTLLSDVDSIKFFNEDGWVEEPEEEVIDIDEGVLTKASFKVSVFKSVYFSQGNLQFNAAQGTHKTADSTAQGTWRFAENQYDIIGADNKKISSTYDGWIDLFGWGTSGWGETQEPWTNLTSDAKYSVGGSPSNCLTGDFANADWGVYNAVSNGGDAPETWRTLTKAEWLYLFKKNAWALGTVDGQVCFLLIPKDFILPVEINKLTLSSDSTTSTSLTGLSVPTENTYTAAEFKLLENAGVVALPLGGVRLNLMSGVRGTTTFLGKGSTYWSSTTDERSPSDSLKASGLIFSSTAASVDNVYRHIGACVRLVTDANCNIKFVNPSGKVLLDTIVERGVKPTYTRGVPTKASTEDYSFQFKGWDKKVVAATKNVVYTAVYDSTFIFITKENGALTRAKFMVSPTKSVYFSQGNLQYNNKQGSHFIGNTIVVATGSWRFAENQYDVIGEANENISVTYDGWIDLFGWGTSGCDLAKAYKPYSTSESNAYYCIKDSVFNLTGDYAKLDWGVYNSISNSGSETNMWRTLTMMEWKYLFKNNKWTLGYVKTSEKDSCLCYFLLPEEFEEPEGVNMTVISKDLTLTKGYVSKLDPNSYAANTYTVAQFNQLEKSGVVALPCAGRRVGTEFKNPNFGYYWSSTAFDTTGCSAFEFNSDEVWTSSSIPLYNGISVRLVQAREFDVKFCNSDGTVLQVSVVSRGVIPTPPADPTKEASESYTYQFKGWDKPLVAAESDAVYTAVYDSSYIGTIRAAFRVSASKSVYFSQGNLQFTTQGTHKTTDGTAQGTWRFAENQYDYIGSANSNISETYDGWIDLFGWGTSGWGETQEPWTNVTYNIYGSPSNCLTGTYANADWGVYNAISNGGNEPNKWRTLTNSEWRYLIKYNKWTLGYIKTTEKDSSLCFMLIPETFTAPEGTTVAFLSPSTTSNATTGLTVPSTNKYTTEQFASLEKLGVVALPCGGRCSGTSVTTVGSLGYYWSSSAYDSYDVYSFFFNSTEVFPSKHVYRSIGLSVRLVQDVQ